MGWRAEAVRLPGLLGLLLEPRGPPSRPTQHQGVARHRHLERRVGRPQPLIELTRRLPRHTQKDHSRIWQRWRSPGRYPTDQCGRVVNGTAGRGPRRGGPALVTSRARRSGPARSKALMWQTAQPQRPAWGFTSAGQSDSGQSGVWLETVRQHEPLQPTVHTGGWADSALSASTPIGPQSEGKSQRSGGSASSVGIRLVGPMWRAAGPSRGR